MENKTWVEENTSYIGKVKDKNLYYISAFSWTSQPNQARKFSKKGDLKSSLSQARKRCFNNESKNNVDNTEVVKILQITETYILPG